MSIFEEHHNFKKTIIKYILLSLFLFIFQFVYHLFGHGVKSVYMSYAFILPILLGVFRALIIRFFYPSTVFEDQIWDMGLHTIIIGSIFHGIFDIYGTTVSLVQVFFIVGGLLLGVSLLLYLRNLIRNKNALQ